MCVVFYERECSNQKRFLYRRVIFNIILSGGCFYIIYGKEIHKTRMSFLKHNEFESGFKNFGNIF